MKHRLKGLLALMLSLVMVFALATNAWATVWIGGVEMGDGTRTTYYKNGDSVGALTGGANDYNAMLWTDNGVLTLTLNNFAYNGSDGITATENLTIDLIGSNTVADTASATSGGAAVVVMGDLTITSENNGSLNASSANNNGIRANDITIDKADLTIGCLYGLNADHGAGIVTISNGSKLTINATTGAINCATLNLNDDVTSGGSLWYQWTTTNGGTPNTSKLLYNGEKYLKIEPITYTVTFDANGHGTAPSAQSGIAAGGKVTVPANPTENGWTFGGWYKEAACTNAYDFNSAVNSSFTLYAKWTENSGGGPGSYWSGPNTISPDDSDKSATKTESPDTFDGGIASAVVVTILSATGGAWLAKKKD